MLLTKTQSIAIDEVKSVVEEHQPNVLVSTIVVHPSAPLLPVFFRFHPFFLFVVYFPCMRMM